MSLAPQKFREMVFQMLYSCDYARGDAEDIIAMMMEELKIPKSAAREAYARVLAILDKSGEIDEIIGKTSVGYEFERISRVEKNVLRLGIFELKWDASLPGKVAIAEALRVCRKFGTPESAGFVNAILDNVYSSSKEGVCALASDSSPGEV